MTHFAGSFYMRFEFLSDARAKRRLWFRRVGWKGPLGIYRLRGWRSRTLKFRANQMNLRSSRDAQKWFKCRLSAWNQNSNQTPAWSTKHPVVFHSFKKQLHHCQTFIFSRDFNTHKIIIILICCDEFAYEMSRLFQHSNFTAARSSNHYLNSAGITGACKYNPGEFWISFAR